MNLRREVGVPGREEASAAARKQPRRLLIWSAADESPVESLEESPLKRSEWGTNLSRPV
jgi:hypothetical protein